MNWKFKENLQRFFFFSYPFVFACNLKFYLPLPATPSPLLFSTPDLFLTWFFLLYITFGTRQGKKSNENRKRLNFSSILTIKPIFLKFYFQWFLASTRLDLESQPEFTDSGHTELTKPTILFKFFSWFCSLFPVRETSTLGSSITGFIINIRRRMRTLTTRKEVSCFPTSDGSCWRLIRRSWKNEFRWTWAISKRIRSSCGRKSITYRCSSCSLSPYPWSYLTTCGTSLYGPRFGLISMRDIALL